MRVVALVSGGKDSFYSIIECNRLGHEVVALANLHPPLDRGEHKHQHLMTKSLCWSSALNDNNPAMPVRPSR